MAGWQRLGETRNYSSAEEVTVELRLKDEQGHNQWDGGIVHVDNNENKDSEANKDRNPQNLEFSFSFGGRHSFKVLNRQ